MMEAQLQYNRVEGQIHRGTRGGCTVNHATEQCHSQRAITLQNSEQCCREQVVILEKQQEAGSKILISGGTRWCVPASIA